MNNKPIVIGLGEFLWDMLPTGKKAGGAPANFAYHASQNGAEGWAVSAVGDDALGRELTDAAGRHGINMEVSVLHDYPTGTVKVELKDGQPEYTICEDVAWDFIPVTEKALSLAGKCSAISFGTLAQRSPVSRLTTRTLIKAAPADALIVYDINLRQHFYNKEIITASMELSDILKINDEEIKVIAPMFGLQGLDYGAACRKLISAFGLKMVVLTGGAEFSSVYTDDSESTIPTPRVEVVDTVGAGDSFSGAFVASLLSGLSVPEAHKAAVDTAAYVCTQAGAWTPPR